MRLSEWLLNSRDNGFNGPAVDAITAILDSNRFGIKRKIHAIRLIVPDHVDIPIAECRIGIGYHHKITVTLIRKEIIDAVKSSS